MRKAWRVVVAFGLWSLASVLAAEPPHVPASLEDWRAWALYGYDTAACPLRGSDASTAECRWPGVLTLEVDARGARFSQTWLLDAAQRVPLPGSHELRPVEVQVDGRTAPVVMQDGEPMLSLEAGRWRIDGHIAWTRRPPTVPVPDSIALIALRVDGVTVARPERNEDGDLVLGEAGADESDNLQLELQRLLADGSPQFLYTRVLLSVSGRPREMLLAPVLPEGFVPVALESQVPARLEPDGRMRVQLRSGQWALTLVARAPTPREKFVLPDAGEVWPAQEIWQFRADPQFRLAQLLGLPGVDPSQVPMQDWGDGLAEVSTQWRQPLQDAEALPAYLFERGNEARLEIALRGLPAQRPPRLSLQRQLWLDFDGAGFSATDRVSGDIGGLARLDLQAPWRMQRAQIDDARGLLITTGATPGTTGVELRDADVELEADARVERAGIARANGWTHAFDHAHVVLQLPPGYRLLAATGADRADGSWWQAWRLSDLFLLSLSALLAWRLGGAPLLGLTLAWGVLAWHEPDAPRWSVFALLLSTLAARHLVAGWAGRILRALRWLTLASVVLLGLGFAATELRLALYPQLERQDASGRSSGVAAPVAVEAPVEMVMEEAVPQAPAPASAPMRRAESKSQRLHDELEQVVVTGSRIKAMDLFSYPADAVVQSGSARPNWQWHRHDLVWQGPLLPDDELGLVLSPPPLTRLWRVAAVLLLVALLWRLLRSGPRVRRAPAAPPAAAGGAIALLICLGSLAPQPAAAQATPDGERLVELRDRLLARTEPCRPNCAALGATTVAATGTQLTLALLAQAQAEVVWPLPRPDASLTLVALRIDGVEAMVLRDAAGDWVRLERGVHRIDAQYAAEGERWRIAFPLPPAALELQAPGFETVGVDRGRLVGDTLELMPPRVAAAAADVVGSVEPSEAIPPFVRITRTLVLDQQWEMVVSVRRVAPVRGGINLAVPLLAGEQPYYTAPPLRDGHAIVSLPAGVDEVSWHSRLTPSPTFTLAAGDGRAYAEEWLLRPSPLLHLETSGIPQSAGNERLRFLPLPGESLQLTVTRPAAIDGSRFAFENVRLGVQPGQRARDASLSFQLRATQPGQHTLALPEGAELLHFSVDGEDQPRVLDGNRLRLAVRPGEQAIVIGWREAIELGPRITSPELTLGASSSNLHVDVTPPPERWILLTRGPQVGPAVLIWGELAVMLLAAFVLAHFGGTPLRLHHWLLLGLGFSTLSWLAAVVVAAWLLALAWRARHPELVERRLFPWLQLGLGALSIAALLALLIAVPYGLLGQPDMHIVGNGSSGDSLHWFADRSEDGTLPVVQVFSLPLWLYKLAILLWSMWLANALLGWLRWGWDALGRGGGWRPLWRRRSTPASATPAETDSDPTIERPN